MLQVKVLPMRFAALRGENSPASEGDAVRLLVTRPREDSETFAAALKLRGHEAVIAPLLNLRFETTAPIAFDRVQGIIATSANGIRSFAARSSERNLAVYVVGPQTAETARVAGFANVVSAHGDSAALAAKISECADPTGGKLLHVAGADMAGQIRETLEAIGFQVDTVVLYTAVPVETLPAAADAQLRSDALDGVLLFSPRSASTFAALVMRADLPSHCEKLTAFCISTATAAALSPLRFARVSVAASPNQGAMLDLLPLPDVPK
jgi:uroporphyrinogen-III synthase